MLSELYFKAKRYVIIIISQMCQTLVKGAKIIFISEPGST